MRTMKKFGLCAFILAMSVGPVLAGPDGKKKKKGAKKQNKKQKKAPKKRVEKALTLKNGLKVFLVSDPSMDRSAAALSVNVGSMNDGKYPGIAHFLEHMLFLGTKKYPKEGDYKDYLAANNGSSNAYTAYDHTNYFFEIKTDAFEGALDRFSRFFIDPLLTDSGSEREVNAVDSEHSKNLESEYWRARQVYRSHMNPKHPHNNFATGSKETLGGVKNATLVKFYQNTYSSKIMNLVIVSPLPLKKLESWSRSKFSAIPDRGHKAKRAKVNLFDKNIAGHRLDIVSIRDVRDLWIRFELPGSAFDYRSKSHAIVGYVLGHEGKESLLQQLKKEGLATSLSAGGRQLGEQGTFNMTLSLTDKGIKDVDLVLERVFAMINRLRGLKEFPAQLIEQESKMSAINFRFRQVTGASSEAQSLAASMISVPHENLLKNMFLIQKADQTAIRGVLNSLTPENAVVVVLNKNLKTNLTEPHYKVKYAKTPLSDALVARLKKAKPVGAMNLPAPNNFIPSNFNLVKARNAKKPWIFRSKYAEVWLRHDTKFKQPKAAMQFQVFNTNYRSAKSFVLGQIFQAAVTEALNPYTYPMNQAGVSLGVGSERGGITISAGGYSHKLPELLAFAAPFLKECRIDEARFKVIRDAMIRGLKNKARQGAQGHAVSVFRQILREINFTDEEQLAVLEKLTYGDLKAYFASYRQSIYLKGFVYGNMTRKQVKKVTNQFVAALQPKSILPEADRYVARVLKLKPGTSVSVKKEIKSNDSCTLLIYQGDALNSKSRAALQVLNQAMPSKFFGDLRTLQQTGYIVGAFCFEVEDLAMFGFLSQSSLYDTSSLRGRFESFIKHLPAEMDREVTDEKFKKLKAAAIAAITRQRKTFFAELAWNYDAAFNRGGDFGAQKRQVAALKALTKDDFLAATKGFFSENGVRRVSVEVVGSPDRFRFQPKTLEELRKGAEFWAKPKPKVKVTKPEKKPARKNPKPAKKKKNPWKKTKPVKKAKKIKKKAKLY